MTVTSVSGGIGKVWLVSIPSHVGGIPLQDSVGVFLCDEQQKVTLLNQPDKPQNLAAPFDFSCNYNILILRILLAYQLQIACI